MKITTTKFGTLDIDLTPHKRKRGVNSIVESIISEMKSTTGTKRLTAQEKADLHVEIRSSIIG